MSPTICVQYRAYSFPKLANLPKRSRPPIFQMPEGVGVPSSSGSSGSSSVRPVVHRKRRTIRVYSPASSRS